MVTMLSNVQFGVSWLTALRLPTCTLRVPIFIIFTSACNNKLCFVMDTPIPEANLPLLYQRACYRHYNRRQSRLFFFRNTNLDTYSHSLIVELFFCAFHFQTSRHVCSLYFSRKEALQTGIKRS